MTIVPPTRKKMVPRLLLFSKEATHWLEVESRRLGLSISEVIRRIVDEARVRRQAAREEANR